MSLPTRTPRIAGLRASLGARGRLVSKQGQKIAQALTAGVLSGFGYVPNEKAVRAEELFVDGVVKYLELMGRPRRGRGF